MHPEALGYILRLPRILKPSITSLYQLTSTGILIKNNIVQYSLPKHAVVIDGILKEIVVSSCTTRGIDNYLCSAKLHTWDIHCINYSYYCLFISKVFNAIFYNYNRLGYLIISNITCEISSAGIISKIISANGLYYVPINMSGFAHCGENVFLALDKREFIYEFNFKINPPSSQINLINFLVEDWCDISKLKELQAEANRHAIAKIKDFIHENNVLFVGILILILTLTVIGDALFLCYYFKCYLIICAKLLKFYQRTRPPKTKSKSKENVVFKKNVQSEPHTSTIQSTTIEKIVPDISEHREAKISRSQPSFAFILSKPTPQDATSDCITLDF